LDQSIIKTEQLVLNCMWDDPKLLYRMENGEYFLSGIAHCIYDVLRDLSQGSVGASIDSVLSIGNERNSLITYDLLTGIRETEYQISEFESYFTQLRRLYAKNQIRDKLSEVSNLVRPGIDFNEEGVSQVYSRIGEALDVVRGRGVLLRSVDDLADSYRRVLVKRQKGEYKFETGDSKLDSALEVGFAPGQITTIFGATGAGKSAYALNLVNRQINKHIPSLYLSLEMDEISTMDRLIAMRQNAPISNFKTDSDGMIDESAFDMLNSEMQKLQRHRDRFFLVDSSSISLDDFEGIVKESQRRMNSTYLVAIIDLFTMIRDVGTEAYQIEEAMNRLHTITKRNGIHTVIVVQANRNADSANVRNIDQIYRLRPAINHIKNSHAIAERSRIILSVFRPKYY